MAATTRSRAAMHLSELDRQLVSVQVRQVHESLISSSDSAGSFKERFKLSNSELVVVVLFNRKSHNGMIPQEANNVVQG